MKFVALLLATVSADEAAKILAGADCKAEKAVCAEGLCCGTIKDAEKATVLVKDVTAFFATVCSTKPTADQKDGAPYVVQAKADAVTAVAKSEGVEEVKAADAKVKVDGTFTCNAAADGDAASYMTVGAAAIIAAATLLQ